VLMESISFELDSSVKGSYLSTTVTRRGRPARHGKTDVVAREMSHGVSNLYEATACTAKF
jgi:hypothetical protein